MNGGQQNGGLHQHDQMLQEVKSLPEDPPPPYHSIDIDLEGEVGGGGEGGGDVLYSVTNENFVEVDMVDIALDK